MNRRLVLAGIALAPVLSACVTSRVRPPEATPPVAYAAPRPADGGLAPAVLDRWWALYGDAQLEALVDEALERAPDARTALAALQQASAVRRQTLDQLLLPQSTATGSVSRSHTQILSSSAGALGGVLASPGDSNSALGQFGVSWELDLFGRKGAGKRAADADFRAAAFDQAAVRAALAANVAQSLFQARGLALQLKDAEETARLHRELAHIAQAKADAGLTSTGDFQLEAANARAADAAAQDLRAQLLAARRSLLALIGRGFDPVESLPASPVVGAPPAVPATAPGDLLRRRPDVRASEQRIVAASSTLKVDDLALLPTITLDPAATISKSTGPFGYASAAWSVGGDIAAPVLDRPRLVAQIHAQRAVAEQAVTAYEKAVQTAYAEAETALNNLQSDRERVAMLTEAESRARIAADQAKAAYAGGLNDLAAALQAETTWRAVHNQLASAQTTLMERTVQLFKALGGGWAPDRPAVVAARQRTG